MRGEKSQFAVNTHAPGGSPPLARGKEPCVPLVAGQKGITPACAGKSSTFSAMRRRRRDHPRLCGEKQSKILEKCGSSGSPPLVRGKVAARAVSAWRVRITPACAGKRTRCRNRLVPDRDHPRLCGEKGLAPGEPPTALGSPPLVRGKVFVEKQSENLTGITPACAGKSVRLHCCGITPKDHPRLCGEKAILDSERTGS